MLHWSGPATPQQPHAPQSRHGRHGKKQTLETGAKYVWGRASGACGPAGWRGRRNKRPWKRAPTLLGARRRAQEPAAALDGERKLCIYFVSRLLAARLGAAAPSRHGAAPKRKREQRPKRKALPPSHRPHAWSRGGWCGTEWRAGLCPGRYAWHGGPRTETPLLPTVKLRALRRTQRYAALVQRPSATRGRKKRRGVLAGAAGSPPPRASSVGGSRSRMRHRPAGWPRRAS